MSNQSKGCSTQPTQGIAAPPSKFGSYLASGLFAVSLFISSSMLCAPAHSDALSGKGDMFLVKSSATANSGWTSVIIRLDGNLTPTRRKALADLKADIYRHLPVVSSVAARVPTRKLERLSHLAFVKRLSADFAVRKCDEFTVSGSLADVAYQQTGLDGTGVVVAVLDSGVHLVDDLKDSGGHSRLIAQVSMVPNDTHTDDKCGHGTHIAGIIAGSGKKSIGSSYFRTFYGIARNASIVNVRVLDNYGAGTVSSVLSGIQWVISNRVKYNIRIINLSLGHPVGESASTDPLCQALESAWNAGITVVCAAGNRGRLNLLQTSGLDNEGWGTAYGSIQSPANDPLVITVGAMKDVSAGRASDVIATYSSRGPSRLDLVLKPDLVAPGNQIVSLDVDNSTLDNYVGNTNNIRKSAYIIGGNNDWSNTYFRLSGTSMAAPVVAGAAALLLQANPSLSPDTIKARLMISADKWTGPDGNADPCTYGAGYLNIPAALSCQVVATSTAISPLLYRDSSGNVFIGNALWGSNAMWGSNAVWGTGVTNLNAIWGANTVTGKNALWGSSALWGTNAVWGNNAIWGANAVWGSTVWTNNAVWGTWANWVDLTSTAITGE
jgi:serine protease AprX